MNLQDLTIKELIESIDENISETKEVRKRLVIELNQEKDINRKMIKKELVERYDENIFRYKIQKLGIEEMIKDHALYAYRKTAQEGQTQEQFINIELDGQIMASTLSEQIFKQIFKPCSSDGKVYNDSESISNPLTGLY